LFFVSHQLLRFLVDLWHESCAIVYNDGLFDNEVFFLELPPVFMEQLETSLHCAHVLARHAELKVVDKESDFMGPIDSIFVLRSCVSADRASIVFLHAFAFLVPFVAIFEVLLHLLVVLLRVMIVLLIKEVLLLLVILIFLLKIVVLLSLMVLPLPLAFFWGAKLAVFGGSELILFVDHRARSFLVVMISLLLVPI